MKAQRDAESGKKVAASFASTDCLRISVTFNLPAKDAGFQYAFATTVVFTTAFAVTSLNEGELRFLDL
jgi:hypothetical protein